MHPKLTKLVNFTLTTATVCLLFSKTLVAADPIYVGGSNYAWYNIDASAINNNEDRNCREQFGIIPNYHRGSVSNIVKQQLAAMFRNGQRRLRVPVFHATDLTTGTILSSTGGNLNAQGRSNLENFLADINAAGFEEILVGFFPISASNPNNWPFFDSTRLQENWSLIRNLRPIIAGAGMDYKIDLLNEGAAASTQVITRQYTGELWSLYNAAYGKADTVGFSVATGSRVENANPDRSVIGNLAADRYNVMRQVYAESGYGAPEVWDFHFYDDLNLKFAKVDAAMNAQGDNSNIIIGETYYQDPTTLAHIQAISTNREIESIYAWPVTAARGCDGHSDIPFPEQYFYNPQRTETPAAQEPASLPQVEVAPVDPTPAVQPQVVPETPVEQQPAVTPVLQQPAVTPGFTICASSSSDSDGDGWGWENEQSCRVTDASSDSPVQSSALQTPVQSTNDVVTTVVSGFPACRMASSDFDGDGYGWENSQTCLVTGTSSATTTPAAVSVTNTQGTPICQLANSDSDGDGYGWENETSCIVPGFR